MTTTQYRSILRDCLQRAQTHLTDPSADLPTILSAVHQTTGLLIKVMEPVPTLIVVGENGEMHGLDQLIDAPTTIEDRIGALWQSQSIWSQATFGSDTERGPVGPLKHIQKECNEAIARPTDIVEFADIFLLTLDAARRAGFTFCELLNAAEKKHEVCKTRHYPKAANDEPSFHVEEDQAAGLREMVEHERQLQQKNEIMLTSDFQE